MKNIKTHVCLFLLTVFSTCSYVFCGELSREVKQPVDCSIDNTLVCSAVSNIYEKSLVCISSWTGADSLKIDLENLISMKAALGDKDYIKFDNFIAQVSNLVSSLAKENVSQEDKALLKLELSEAYNAFGSSFCE